ncbi:hypothetical protein DMB95_09315 [Campylobacter sp. MIT 12-8780]|uniref:hypothetical protein n=1 Tax=unclassified Campylobacter TaxID=2593542 RepID=UPI0010F8FABC|nr:MULTISPECIES: hypothetical protein [unclassified Campylobacter]NDJ28052.1 hypothetical protein [Campylobacter sp. MIT 19-121]TKX28279.1 hypothetical protein CQA38_08515 [Campylobacter sp. MIT 12-5580]TQR39979.1 hypothetical protein DMB95_09315 [Campylobacter sp. MIT 12-8780]
MKKFLFNINEENLAFITNISKKTKTPKSKVVNKIISIFINNDKENTPNKVLHYKQELYQAKTKQVKIFFTQNEYDFIKESAKKNGYSFLTQEVRYRIFNSIYNDKFSNSIELRQFILTKTSLNQMGRNINELNKILKQRSAVKVNIKNLEDTLQNIIYKIDQLTQNINTLVDKSEDKIK